MKLTDFKALTFDCYGTLIDWESGMIEALQPLTSRTSRSLFRATRSFKPMRAMNPRNRRKPRRNSIATCWRSFIAGWRRSGASPQAGTSARPTAARSRNWPAFSDSAEALQHLKRHYKLVILSNVDNDSFSFSNGKLKVEFDAIYTAEDLRLLQAVGPQFRIHAGQTVDPGDRETRDPPHGRKPVP